MRRRTREPWLRPRPPRPSPDARSPACRPASPRADGLPPAGVAWAPEIQDAATKGLDPLLLASLVWVEWAFDPAAVSPVGALGLAQVMPATAAELGIDPHNAEQNLAGEARYLKDNLDRFGRTGLALAAYNAGPGRVAEVRAIPAIRETQDYLARVGAGRVPAPARLAAQAAEPTPPVPHNAATT